jgi:hypothetical protein
MTAPRGWHNRSTRLVAHILEVGFALILGEQLYSSETVRRSWGLAILLFAGLIILVGLDIIWAQGSAKHQLKAGGSDQRAQNSSV